MNFSTARQVPDDAQVLGVPVFAGRTMPDGAGVDLDLDYLARRKFDGKAGQVLALAADDGSTVVAVGVGEPAKVTVDSMRRAAAALLGAAGDATSIATTLLAAIPPSIDKKAAAQAIAEGMALAAYRFTTYKSEADRPSVETVTVVGGGQAALDRGARVAEAVALARDLVNEPAGAMTPTRLAELATEIAEREGLTINVLDEVAIENEGLGALRGVSLGSDEPPRLIELVYEPAGRSRGTVALVGKGITFDSGGLSLKTADGMMTMKTDMAGGAAVLATMAALPALGIKTKVIGLIPTTENMPGGKAIKPGDVLKARNGKTIEVLNTDAEGRLVLADGLSLAVEAKPDAIIDLATLTGAQVVALGRRIAGLMATNDSLLEQVEVAADKAGEPVWELPLPDIYRKDIDSEIADVKNIGRPGQAGTLIAGLFLREFTGDVPWVHMDIAGPARSDEDDAYLRKGGTGFGVRTLLELLTSFTRPS
ncbi:MAG TPA: leucyl aminopeptidase [Acidimicrobiales bacterium]|nr:leucyl aminopeptidase [Acidimicrobiales bacterium]